MIRIDELNLTLPESLRPRFDAILRHTAGALADRAPAQQQHLTDLGNLNITLNPRSSSFAIGRNIASAIMNATSKAGGQNG